jgi:replication factor C subunit 1
LRNVPWSPRLGALIIGDDAAGRWKYKTAIERGVRIIKADDLLSSTESVEAAPALLWTEKYRPSRLQDVIGNGEAIAALQGWLRTWSPTASGARGALVTGPPGIGKTTAVHLVVAAAGMSVIEFNASDTRSATAVRQMFTDAAKSGHMGTKRVIVMDEVDGMSSGDRGGIGELARLIRSCAFPVICIANDRGSPRLRPLASTCLDVRFDRPTKGSIAKALVKSVVAAEGLQASPALIEALCERNGNDIRSILNFLQFGGGGCGARGKDGLLRMDAYKATGRLFAAGTAAAVGTAAAGTASSVDDRLDLFFVDHSMVPLMVSEGYIAAAGGVKGRSDAEKLERIAAAADRLGTWDMIDATIHRRQAWGLLPAAATEIVAAAGAVAGPAPFQIFPQLLGKMSKRNKIRRAQADIQRRTGIGSALDLADTRPLLRQKLFGAAAMDATAVCDTLMELGLTRDDMFETLSETVFTGDEKTVAIDSKLKAAITREMNKRVDTRKTSVGAGEEEDYVDSEDEEEIHMFL